MKTFFMWIAQTVLKVKGLFSFGSENWNSFEGHSDFFPRLEEKAEVLVAKQDDHEREEQELEEPPEALERDCVSSGG